MILVNKPMYLTSYQTIEKLREKENIPKDIKLGYAGTLDPMAQGLLLILKGEENKERYRYIGKEKEYEFEVVWGVDTDSHDLLGKLLNISAVNKYNSLTTQSIQQTTNSFIGRYEQKFPHFSAKYINGKRLYHISKEGLLKEKDLPSFTREIFSIDVLKEREITREQLLQEVKKAVSTVKGHFRQDEIYKTWEDKKDSMPKTFKLRKMKAVVSSGTYIRRLVYDMGHKLNTHAITYSIKRTRIGEYTLKNAKIII